MWKESTAAKAVLFLLCAIQLPSARKVLILLGFQVLA